MAYPPSEATRELWSAEWPDRSECAAVMACTNHELGSRFGPFKRPCCGFRDECDMNGEAQIGQVQCNKRGIMPQVTTFDSSSSPTLPRLRRRQVSGSASRCWPPSCWPAPARLSPRVSGAKPPIPLAASSPSGRPRSRPHGRAAPASGFPAPGQPAHSQLTTEDGRRLHLVIDARTNTIIGAKLVELQASRQRAEACPARANSGKWRGSASAAPPAGYPMPEIPAPDGLLAEPPDGVPSSSTRSPRYKNRRRLSPARAFFPLPEGVSARGPCC